MKINIHIMKIWKIFTISISNIRKLWDRHMSSRLLFEAVLQFQQFSDTAETEKQN